MQPWLTDTTVVLKRHGQRLQAYFDLQATEIQRRFRGFYSRKYVHSMHARRAYIAAAMRNAAGAPQQLLRSAAGVP